MFSTHILGQKVDLVRNVTSSRQHVLGHKVDLIRNVTTSRCPVWAIKLTYKECDTVTFSIFSIFEQFFFYHIAVFEQFLVSIWAIKLTL